MVEAGRIRQPADGVEDLLRRHADPAQKGRPRQQGRTEAGKNTYTYDAHTYHTKVPPQGIAEILRGYLPSGGGLVLDPFAGSGMTGVASSVTGNDCILNELSPAACFIAHGFTGSLAPGVLAAAVNDVLAETQTLRRRLYTTTCRECGRPTELLYTVWSYKVVCPECTFDFPIWDACRRYGRTVREHKILSRFDCPSCGRSLSKSRLRRTVAVPVEVGYKCCGSRQREINHPPDAADLRIIENAQAALQEWRQSVPHVKVPDGLNLRQPVGHGLDSVEKWYTPRNLAALGCLWDTINRVEDLELAPQLGFAFTSLYRRVTRLSEFRFWGGSGNTAHLNVPFIFDEANVFLAFARKARTIEDHIETTTAAYRGQIAVVNGSATDLSFLPDRSIDLIFTDPPFGGNINYSDMNFLWEAWLGRFTDTAQEAIINKLQGKGEEEYRQLMAASLRECARVLRPGAPLLLVFMNSSKRVWQALQHAISDAGLCIAQADAFDKRHGTFKQFVSPNTAGMDLILHLRRAGVRGKRRSRDSDLNLEGFLRSSAFRRVRFQHVRRDSEVDLRSLYSNWVARCLEAGAEPLDFARFRDRALAFAPASEESGEE